MTTSAAANSPLGSLYVVATPIGNLDDISARALNILRSVALIAAEDTRHSARLMQHFGISTPLAACHEHNEREEGSRFIVRLLAGDGLPGLGAVNVSLRISTGGTPATDALGMKGSNARRLVHLCPRSQPASGDAIGKDPPPGSDGAPTAPRAVHRSLEIMDSRR